MGLRPADNPNIRVIRMGIGPLELSKIFYDSPMDFIGKISGKFWAGIKLSARHFAVALESRA